MDEIIRESIKFDAPFQHFATVIISERDIIQRIYNMEVGGGTSIQVGSGSTAAARTDYKIETALGTAPEDDLFDTGSGSYAAGATSVAGAITAGGSGTINEVVLAGHWYDETADNFDDFCLFHDILVSGEAFTPAQTITVAYTLNL